MKAHLCPEGYYCPLGTGAKSAEGDITGETFEHIPIPCPEGSFGSVQGLAIVEQCSPCPAGFYCPTQGKGQWTRLARSHESWTLSETDFVCESVPLILEKE